MSMFDRPGMLNAVREWNESRSAESAAAEACDKARLAHFHALVRMGRAHKNVVAVAAPEDAHLFSWCESLHGKRDEILAAAERAGSQP